MEVLKLAPFSLVALVLMRWWFYRFRHIEIGPLLLKVIGAALLAARLAFVLTHGDVYSSEPFKLFDLDDGGFSATTGMFAAVVIATESTHQATRQRGPMAMALAGGLLAWSVALIVMPGVSPAHISLPAAIVQQLNGKPINLLSFADKPVVMNLWATWCPPCRRELPILRDAQSRHKDIHFVFVNEGEERESIRRYLDDERLALRNVFSDRSSDVVNQTNSAGMPTTLFFDRHGELLNRHVGALTAESLEIELAKLGDAK